MSEIDKNAWTVVSPPDAQTTTRGGDPGSATRKTDKHALARHRAGVPALTRTRR
ncbi:hypothetical protein [Caballeronia hypogeia]|uniref:hypothetical protein n=1 Tax=Caballeronia hypogeia TaxID=1777140 RepID=UPI000AEAC917|nr:hypothetical protein [Caballeronia hypogeia]